MSNVEFIINYLRVHPGSKSGPVREALCRAKDKEFRPGVYTWYFQSSAQNPYTSHIKQGADYGYWEKVSGGWYVTPKGYRRLHGIRW